MILFTDGASRGNPGEAGIGFVLFNNNTLLLEGSYYLGRCTNNVAEITAILVALYSIRENFPSYFEQKITIKSDSLLLINQFNKKFSIKNKKLYIGHILFHNNFGNNFLEFIHIPREENKIADHLANKGINEKIILPKDISSFIFQLLF